jgi:colicin import membrane protein
MPNLQPWIKSFWVAPKSNETKKAVINFTLQADGSVSNVNVKESSGDELFDAVAKDALEKAAPMPIPPASLNPPVAIDFHFDYNIIRH